MSTPPDKFLVAVTLQSKKTETPRSLGFVVVDGEHNPFKPWIQPGPRLRFPAYRTVVYPIRPLQANSDYFNFLSSL
jgi:hypothetical protein